VSGTDSITTDVLVIGAGVIGLASAAKISGERSVIVVDRYPQFGRETSSRNSEVIHSGIYYPKDSLKTKWCLSGRQELYEYCESRKVPYQKCGKFVVATEESDEAYLDKLIAHCESLDVPCRKVGSNEIEKAEPLVRARSGVFFPETGTVDSHQYMASLERSVLDSGGILAYQHEVVRLERMQSGWLIELKQGEEKVSVEAKVVVNCAGLAAAEISDMALATKRYEHRYCRGRYFMLSPRFQRRFRHLIYPVPVKDGLGVHVTIDLEGYARLGPDTDWCLGKGYREADTLYDCDWETLLPSFLASAQRYCPNLGEGDLSPSLIGIRPKLFLDGVAHPDFLVENHNGFIHCLGIESPGLTASLSIANVVKSLVARE
jgi:2-hydroxyglutarate dehydrogenase